MPYPIDYWVENYKRAMEHWRDRHRIYAPAGWRKRFLEGRAQADWVQDAVRRYHIGMREWEERWAMGVLKRIHEMRR